MSFNGWLQFLRSALAPGRGERKGRPRGAKRAPPRPKLDALEDRTVPAFLSAVNYDVGASPQAVAAGYFDAGTTLDLVVANYSSSTVSVLLGNSDGTFQPAQSYSTGSNPLSVAVGDLDGDLDMDLATANFGSDDVSVLLGNGDGTFGDPQSLPIPAPLITAPPDPPLSVAVGDLNKDGKLDLVVSSQYTQYFYGGGGWGYYGGWYGGGWSSVTNGYVHVLMGTGGGNFAPPTTTQLSSGSPVGLAVSDLNGDTWLDVVTANSDTGTVSVLLNNGTGALGAPRDYTTGWYPQSVAVGNFNGDAIPDLVTAGQTVDVLLGLGGGTFQPVPRVYIDPTSVATADFNGDGKLDVVVADPSGGTVNVLLGNGAGALSLSIPQTAGSSPNAVTVGDFNGDRRPDVAATNAGSGNISVLLNDGSWPAPGAPSLSISDVTVTEGNAGTVAVNFTVTRSAAYSQPITFGYATAAGSGTAGSDYQAASGTLTIDPTETTETITVFVNGDLLGEYDESFYVNLTGAFVTDGRGQATITDDEPRVTIDAGPTVTEGNTGTRTADFTVRLSAASTEEVHVDFSTADVGWYYYYPPATAGSDYQAASGTLIFKPGDTEEIISVPILGDREGESDESFSVNLSGASGAFITSGYAEGAIVDDEPWVNIDYYGTTVTEGHSGTVAATFTVTLSGEYDEPVSVDFATLDGSALAGSDYQARAGTVTFKPGESLTQTITVLINGDRAAEYAEYYHVQLSNPAGARISNGWGYGTIQDDDPHITIGDVRLQEGSSGTKLFVFTVTLSAASTEDVTVNYATQDGSAQAGSDYVATSGALIFKPGEMTKTISVVVNGDGTNEYEEYFSVQLNAASANAMIDDGWAYGSIVNDDAPPSKGGRKRK